MINWVNFDKIIANRDFISLDTDWVQGPVFVDDLWDVIKDYNLDKLETIYYESERNILTSITKVTYYPDGEIKTEEIFSHNDLKRAAIDGIDPLNAFGRVLVNKKLMELSNNEHNN